MSVFQSLEHGPFVMVLVGATIATTWHGVVNPKRTKKPSELTYPVQRIAMKQGEEMGRFLLGSTIVILFRQGSIIFNEDWTPERPARLGEIIRNRAT